MPGPYLYQMPDWKAWGRQMVAIRYDVPPILTNRQELETHRYRLPAEALGQTESLTPQRKGDTV